MGEMIAALQTAIEIGLGRSSVLADFAKRHSKEKSARKRVGFASRPFAIRFTTPL